MNAPQRVAARRSAKADLFTPRPSAVLSECGLYRYTLTRTWDPKKLSVVFVMINPSTADASQDDPTIRKCMGFAERWGHGGIVVVNLFAFRSTEPDRLNDVADPIGPDNHAHWLRAFQPGARVVCAWGAKAIARDRGLQARELLHARGITPDVLRFTKLGAPEHPLFVPYEVTPAPWPFLLHV